MKAKRHEATPWRCVLLAILGSVVAGCASVQLPAPLPPEVSQTRKQRRAAMVSEFEASRDRAQFEAAADRWEQGDVGAARKQLEQIIDRSPGHREARLLLAEVLLSENRPGEAVRHVEAVLQANPRDAHAHYTVGLLLDATGRTEEAAAHYREAARIEPANRLYRLACRQPRPSPRAEGGAAASEEGMVRCEAVSHAPMPPGRSATDNAACRKNAGCNASTAATMEDAPMAHIEKGRRLLAEGATEAAMRCFREARHAQPDNPQIPITSAVCALESNQPDAAVAILEEVAAAFPDSAALYRTLGMAHYRCGDYRASQLVLQQALSLDKSSALAYFLMGCVLKKIGQPGPAEGHLRQARQLDARYDAVR
jgi:tetratricopeptide (TPR) repeat protein